MKTLANRLTVFAASVIVLGTMAYGQTRMNVEIPFDFQVGRSTLPAGDYLLHRVSDGLAKLTAVENVRSHQQGFAIVAIMDTTTATANSSVLFICQNGSCALSAIRTDNGTLTYPRPRRFARERGEISFVSIPVTPRNGD